MIRHTIANVLLVVGIALLVAPMFAPIQPVLYHDTHRGTMDNRSQLEAQGYEIVAYENLSDRGKELYVRTLREGGQYHVPTGAGAAEFAYPSPDELAQVEDYRKREALTTVVIERPPDADLPPPDEPVDAAEHIEERRKDREEGRTGEHERQTGQSVEERRQQIARYEVLTTQTGRPPLTATASLLRLLSTVLGVTALGLGGYLRSLP